MIIMEENKQPWFAVQNAFPGIEGITLHTVRGDADAIIHTLQENNFVVYALDGEKITDKATFFEEAARVFGVPDYFGKGWASWGDYLDHLGNQAGQRTAVVWSHADKIIMADVHTFLQAVADLYGLATSIQLEWTLHPENNSPAKQFEIFIVGQTDNFLHRISSTA
jgi:RNAse (barnase) inhibitor barstar